MDWLDYAIELGASGLLLGPVFASQTHSYDTVDQFHIDLCLGGEEDFDAFVAACSQRGLRPLLDGASSHVGAQHPGVIRALDEGPGGSIADLFDIDWSAPGGPAPYVLGGHVLLVRLNHASERAAQYVTAVMEHWLARGIDGWRLDAVYSVDTGFWVRVIPATRDRHPNVWFLGEVIHGDHPWLVASSGLDATTQYELWKAIWSSIKDRNFFELDWAPNRYNGFLTHFTPNTFTGNHDVTRIASVIGSDGAVMALAILLTLGGISSIYYGDEQGFIGIKEEWTDGDDAIWSVSPDTPSELADWGQNVHRAYQDLIGLWRRNPRLVTTTTMLPHLENTRYTYHAAARDGSNHLDVVIDIAETPSLVIENVSGHILWERRHQVPEGVGCTLEGVSSLPSAEPLRASSGVTPSPEPILSEPARAGVESS